jgi:hypothetical protein
MDNSAVGPSYMHTSQSSAAIRAETKKTQALFEKNRGNTGYLTSSLQDSERRLYKSRKISEKPGE